MKTIVAAPLDWSQGPGVERNPGKVGGAWLFKNTRMPVSIVFQDLEAGMTVEEIMEQRGFVNIGSDRRNTFIMNTGQHNRIVLLLRGETISSQ